MSNSTKNAKGTVVESFKDIIPLSFGEEIGNSVSHGVAALLTLFLLPYAAVHRYIAHGTLSSVS
ncbi:MAG: hemolysin III family protein, partial [Staphylococcus sp.]|nr:hemolysin III family protein [Staphylococcus sp.]